MPPETRYARSGDVHIAYQVVGDGPIDLVWVPGWISNIDLYWEEPTVASYFERLASFSRLILFDRRGTGVSDPVARAPTLEEQMDDVVAVMNAAGSEKAGLYAQLEGGAMAVMFAATHPERTRALILYEAMPRMAWAPDYDWAMRPEQREAILARPWGDGSRITGLAPSAAANPRLRRWFARLERGAASPATAAQLVMMNAQVDVRAVLPQVQAPTLVLHRARDTFVDIRHSRYLAEHIPGARFVELPGSEVISFGEDNGSLIEEVEELLTGTRTAKEPQRVLATVMFGDIVGSTERAAELGDRRWRELLGSFSEAYGQELRRFRGRTVKALGDGVLATFDGPARAIMCAEAVRGVAKSEFGLELRAAMHAGEVEVIGDDIGGIAVHIAARILGCAGPGELVVSGTVKDLVVGSGIEFEDRGEHDLRGVPGPWHLWKVQD
jgi:class 3 adenylate cyclase/alpha-beta hydrolase superfamily lysophospholipase